VNKRIEISSGPRKVRQLRSARGQRCSRFERQILPAVRKRPVFKPQDAYGGPATGSAPEGRCHETVILFHQQGQYRARYSDSSRRHEVPPFSLSVSQGGGPTLASVISSKRAVAAKTRGSSSALASVMTASRISSALRSSARRSHAGLFPSSAWLHPRTRRRHPSTQAK
jgi:hypothetical protein